MQIYLITNSVNEKTYVGQTTKTAQWRWRGHVRAANHGSMLPLHCAIRFHGEAAFNVCVLEVCESRDELDTSERAWIVRLDSIRRGYNLCEGGRTNRTQIGAANPKFGKRTPDEVKRKISAALRGFRHCDATCDRMSEAAKGRRHSEETKLKIGNASRGHTVSSDVRMKIAAATSHPLEQRTLDGEFVALHASVKAAAEVLSAPRTALSRNISLGKAYRGYMWRRVDGNQDEL